MRPTIVVVSHTHWDREWYQPFEVFRLRLCEMVQDLLELLDHDPRFRHFMLDGQTVCIDDVIEVQPSLLPGLRAHVQQGRLGVGPWYVLQDEFLVGAESIVRNLAEGLRAARRLGQAMPIGYLPDAFGHIAQMPRILRGFGIEDAVVWRGVGDRAPGSEWRWRAPSGAEVLCLFLPQGYGNAHGLGNDRERALAKLTADLDEVMPLSRASVLVWMNGNDHQPAEADLPAVLEALQEKRPDVQLEHASLERAIELVRERVDVTALPVVEGELRKATPTVPVLSGVWSSRSWQKRDHDRAEALLVRFVEPFVALAGADRRAAIDHAWRILLRCQPHDSICGCSIDAVHEDIEDRLRHVEQLGRSLLELAAQSLLGSPTRDFALHDAIAILNPHPFTVSGEVEVELQRSSDAGPFRLMSPAGEVSYEIVSRWPSDGPDRRPSEWLRLRIDARDLPPLGLRVVSLERGAPGPATEATASISVFTIAGGIEIVDDETGIRVTHTFEDEEDRGDLYDFCPREGRAPRSSRNVAMGGRGCWRVVGRRVEIDVEIDQQTPDRRLRARFDLSTRPASILTDTAFGWLERTSEGTHPVTTTVSVPGLALGGMGLHEVERRSDGAILLTLLRAVGRMSRGDLSTRLGHAGYAVITPDAQGLGTQRFRYTLAFGPEAVRDLQPGLLGLRAVALTRAAPLDRAFLSIEPADVRLSILKRSETGALLVRMVGPPHEAVVAHLRFYAPLRRAWWSDLDERMGAELPLDSATGELSIPIAAHEVVTIGVELQAAGRTGA